MSNQINLQINNFTESVLLSIDNEAKRLIAEMLKLSPDEIISIIGEELRQEIIEFGEPIEYYVKSHVLRYLWTGIAHCTKESEYCMM